MAQLFVFDTDILLPKRAADPGAPVPGEAWYNETTHEFKYQTNTGTVVIGAGLSNEQVQDIVGAFFADSADLDVTYDDAGNIVSAIVKNDSMTFAKMQNIATGRLLGRVSAGGGDIEELTAAQVKALLAITSADIANFIADVRASISVLDTATVNLTYAGGQITADVLDAPSVNGMTAAQIQAAVVAAIVDGAPGTLDTLNEIAAALGDNPDVINQLLASVALRARQFEGTYGNGALTEIDVPHALATYDLTYAVWDVAAPRAERHPGAEKPDNNTLRLTFNAAPANASIRVVVQAK